MKAWRILAPGKGTSDPATVEFPEPLDHALLEHELEVADSSGNLVEGRVEIDRDETRWQWIPKDPWKAGNYSIRVGVLITDLAGNRVDRPFEIDLLEKVDKQLSDSPRILHFTIN